MATSNELTDLKFAAKFPFSVTAKRFISGKSVTLDFDVMERAVRRVIGGASTEDIPTLDTDDQKRLNTELLSYPVARMIASLIDRRFTARYMNAEVRRTARYMQSSEADMFRLASEFGIEVNGYRMSLRSYLQYIPKGQENRLISQNVQQGWVILDQERTRSVVAEAARESVEHGMPLRQESIPPEILKDIESSVKEVEEGLKGVRVFTDMQAVAAANASSSEIAPCMQKIIDRSRGGENIPHMARVAIATYLLKKGFPDEFIVEVISHTPNYNEKITRYQIDFIKKKGYTPTSCLNMDSFGLRLPDCNCLGAGRIKNPMQFGSKFVPTGRGRRQG